MRDAKKRQYLLGAGVGGGGVIKTFSMLKKINHMEEKCRIFWYLQLQLIGRHSQNMSKVKRSRQLQVGSQELPLRHSVGAIG